VRKASGSKERTSRASDGEPGAERLDRQRRRGREFKARPLLPARLSPVGVVLRVMAHNVEMSGNGVKICTKCGEQVFSAVCAGEVGQRVWIAL
jgi:hypothetical protein